MDRGNVLVIGNSGVGKSTLINAVLGEEKAKTGWGTSGTTDRLEIYESEMVPFRIIDSIGFEPSLVKEYRAIHAVRKWSKECAKKGKSDNQINLIWFCVDGTARKLFEKSLQDLARATSMWKSVPVIVVITKSYSIPEREENIEMVYNAFAKMKHYSKNLKKVLPVVASTFSLNDSAFAPPDGISELIDATNKLLPEGIQAAEYDIHQFVLNRKKAMAQSVVAMTTGAAAVVGAVPIPIADAMILSPLELAEINGLAQIYGIGRDEQSKKFLNSILEVGTVSVAAKAAISALKAIPGLNIATSVLNAVIAGSIAAAMGEGCIYVFEQIYLGKKTVADIDWVTKIMENSLAIPFIDAITQLLGSVGEGSDMKDIIRKILEIAGKNSLK